MSNVSAGIVLFNPDLNRLAENIDAIYEKVELLVLVDNKSDNFARIKDLYGTYLKILIIENDTNLGIATALNQIMECSMHRGFRWVLTLDQDSVCPDNLIDEYTKIISNGIDKLAIVSPVIVDRNMVYNLQPDIESPTFEKIKKCITSGSLINTFVWDQIGKFDDVMFIDGVDFEFCTRVIEHGFCIVKSRKTKLLHEIGRITVHRLLFLDVIVQNHNPFRKYYIARNTIYIARKHFSYKNIVIAYLRVIKLMTKILLYEKYKKEKMQSVIKGIIDSNKI